jgi:hypothetical protein
LWSSTQSSCYYCAALHPVCWQRNSRCLPINNLLACARTYAHGDAGCYASSKGYAHRHADLYAFPKSYTHGSADFCLLVQFCTYLITCPSPNTAANAKLHISPCNACRW